MSSLALFAIVIGALIIWSLWRQRQSSDPWPRSVLWILAGLSGLTVWGVVSGDPGAAGYLIVAAMIAIVVWLVRSNRSSVVKYRPDLLAMDPAVRAAQAALADTQGVWCGELNGSPLYASIEDRAVVLGPPGTGKSAFLISQILHWAESKRPIVCFDIKPEIYGITKDRLRECGYRLLAYNPSARTGERYNPLDDVDSPEAVGELAAALIPSTVAQDAVFNESARDFLDAIITHLKAIDDGRPTLPDVRQFVADAGDWRNLMRSLVESPDEDARELANGLMATAANERLLGSIFATFRANLRFLRFPAVRESLSQSDFSLSALTTDASVGEPVALFLQFEEAHRETTAHLWAALVAHLMRYLIVHTDRPAVLQLFDEIGNAMPVPGLIQKLNTIRSRQLPTWLYWQSLEQMQKYGIKANEGANIILGACDFQMVFRLNDNASADWMSQRLGVVDRLVESSSVTWGNRFIPNRTDQQSLVKEPKIFPHELQALTDTEAICVYRGRAWRGQAMPYFTRWPELYQPDPDKRPKGAELRGAPYPAAGSQLEDSEN